MVRKDTKLSEILEKLGHHRSEFLVKERYGFRAYESIPVRAKSVFEIPQVTDFEELSHYKSTVNSEVFNMNTEIRNLPTWNLEIVEITPKNLCADLPEVQCRRLTVAGINFENENKVQKYDEDVKKAKVSSERNYEVKLRLLVRKLQ